VSRNAPSSNRIALKLFIPMRGCEWAEASDDVLIARLFIPMRGCEVATSGLASDLSDVIYPHEGL